MKKKYNIIFILLTIMSFFSICLLNYLVDPYDVFKDGYNYYPNDISIVNIQIKAKKNKKNDTAIIGGSESIGIFRYCQYKELFNLIALEGLGYQNYYELLYNYLNIHKETKHVYISLSYLASYSDLPVDISPIENSKFTADELFRILFSEKATNESFQLLKQHIIPNYKNKPHGELLFQPKIINNALALKSVSELESLNEHNFIYIDKIIKMLEERQVKHNFFIPPYNSVALAVINKNKAQKKHFYELKKYIVNKSKYDVYDMSFANEYTNNDLLNDKYTIYYDYLHPNYYFGLKVVKVLFDRQLADNKIYMILTKENFDKQIQYQNQQLNNYMKTHAKTVDEYIRLHNCEKSDYNYTRMLNNKDIPSEFINEKNDIIKLVKQKKREEKDGKSKK